MASTDQRTPGTDSSSGSEQDRRLATIRGLLAKAEATEFEHEAELFFNKASELIARWAIDEAQLWDGADKQVRQRPDEMQLVVHAPYMAQKAILISGVAQAHGCRSVRLSGGKGAKSEVVSIVGFPTDLKWVETLVTSLLVQLTSTMLKSCPSGLSPSGSASWRRSYIVGFAETVSARLQEDRRKAVQETDNASGASRNHSSDGSGGDSESTTQSVALVLASRESEVEDDYRRRYPYLRSSWASAGSSHAGRSAGRRAGREASLTRGAFGSRRSLGR